MASGADGFNVFDVNLVLQTITY